MCTLRVRRVEDLENEMNKHTEAELHNNKTLLFLNHHPTTTYCNHDDEANLSL